MTREEAIVLIDTHKNQLIDPVGMLDWTVLRVIIKHLSDEDWDKAAEQARRVLL